MGGKHRLGCQSCLTNTIHFRTPEFTAQPAHPWQKYLPLSQKLRYTTEMSIYLNALSEVLLISVASQNMFNKMTLFSLVLTSSVDYTYKSVFAFQNKCLVGVHGGTHQETAYIKLLQSKTSVNSSGNAETAFLVCLLQS